jgi:integrase
MGYSQKRAGRDGKPRYTAVYHSVRGDRRSAGTFSSKKDSDKAWQQAELRQAEGRLSDPRRGRQTFRRYVTEEWLPHHVMEATTREGCTYQLNKHIMPWFGPMHMNEIMPSTVREWVSDLQAKGVSPATIQKVRFILSAIFTTALNDVTYLHPCKGVKTPTVPRKPLKIITPEQFDAIYAAIPDDTLRLLVETDIETGLRWGELTELRASDLDLITRVLTISRTVVQVDPKFHPAGGRFLVKEYPKDKECRRLKLSAQLTAKIAAHVKDADLGPGGLLFAMAPQDSPATPAARRARPRRARVHQAQRGRAAVPACDDERLQRWPVPVRLLQGRRRDLPGPAPYRGHGLPPAAPDRGHRRPYSPGLVPAEGLEARAAAGGDHVPRATP